MLRCSGHVRTLFCSPRSEQVCPRLLPHLSRGGLKKMHGIAFPVVLGKIKCIRPYDLSLHKSIQVI